MSGVYTAHLFLLYVTFHFTQRKMHTMTPSHTSDSLLVSLSIDALRQGQSLWFRVASGSMSPLLQVNDAIYIVPAKAQELNRGDIAAFETAEGLMVHRIIHTQSKAEKGKAAHRLLQMSDVVLQPTWLHDQAILGRVMIVRRGAKQVSLHHPIAKWWGWAISAIRYQLYLQRDITPIRKGLRICSHITLSVGYQFLFRCCLSATP